MNTPHHAHFDFTVDNEAGLHRLARDLSFVVTAGDCITLSGDLGVGKSSFARALIRTLAETPDLEIPSPTYTLLQSYHLERCTIIHADFYRLTGLSELEIIGWDEACEGALALIEWPENIQEALPKSRLDITINMAHTLSAMHRHVRLTARGAWVGRLHRFIALQNFLRDTGWADAERIPLKGDASSRRYERLHLGKYRAILMDSPPRPDGPSIKGGLPYSKIVHLAEDVRPFVALDLGLRDQRLSAPEILRLDLENGFILLEDFGSDYIVTGSPPEPVQERYAVAMDVLLALHKEKLPATLVVGGGQDHAIPTYDMEALLTEAELLLEWYLPYVGAPALGAGVRSTFFTLWRMALEPLLKEPKTWVMRDYHSPNLMWLPDRIGNKRIGLLDFQDAVLGHPAYDLVSLLQDARVTIPQSMELSLLSYYAQGRAGEDFDLATFARGYSVLGAQRATKILGIFARLHKRDGKSQYLHHIPRVWTYLQRCLSHPSLDILASWYESYVPEAEIIHQKTAAE